MFFNKWLSTADKQPQKSGNYLVITALKIHKLFILSVFAVTLFVFLTASAGT